MTSNEKELLRSLQEEVQELKHPVRGGVLSNLESRIKGCEDKNTAQDTRLGNIDSHLSSIDNNLSNVDTHLTQIDGKITNIVNKDNQQDSAIDDLKKQIEALKNKSVFMTPDYSQAKILIGINGTVDKPELVSNWNASTNPYSSPYTIQENGFLQARVHVENYESNTTFAQRTLEVTVNGIRIAVAGASNALFKNHLENSDTNMVPVKAGDLVRYGSSSYSPNGAYNFVQVTFFPLRS